jgi:NAD(P)-dependent dehydrogenase (short-subunit alcohol dehydrogenase family)
MRRSISPRISRQSRSPSTQSSVDSSVPRRAKHAENMAKQQAKPKAEFLSEFCRKMGILSGRWAEMDEVASAVVFLASDRARYITGSHLVIDGGFSVNARPA